MSHRTYQERGYCTRAGYARLDEVLGQLCDLGNAALQDPGAPGRAGRTRPAERRGDPRWPSSAGRRGFQAFFRRCKEGGKPGYPQFRSRKRYAAAQRAT